MKRKILTFRYLSPEERTLLGYALPLFPLVALSLQLVGMGRTQSWLAARMPMVVDPKMEDKHRVRTTARMVRVAARYNFLWANCLQRSLVLWFLLRHQGIESQLRIGVQRDDGEFVAHAWVEWNGIVLNDQSDVRQQFAMFERYW